MFVVLFFALIFVACGVACANEKKKVKLVGAVVFLVALAVWIIKIVPAVLWAVK
jgi:hypothetical protein